MNERQVSELLEQLTAAKKPGVIGGEHRFLAGWNAGLDYAIEQLRKVENRQEAVE
jgi:hypothetical protein